MAKKMKRPKTWGEAFRTPEMYFIPEVGMKGSPYYHAPSEPYPAVPVEERKKEARKEQIREERAKQEKARARKAARAELPEKPLWVGGPPTDYKIQPEDWVIFQSERLPPFLGFKTEKEARKWQEKTGYPVSPNLHHVPVTPPSTRRTWVPQRTGYTPIPPYRYYAPTPAPTALRQARMGYGALRGRRRPRQPWWMR